MKTVLLKESCSLFLHLMRRHKHLCVPLVKILRNPGSPSKRGWCGRQRTACISLSLMLPGPYSFVMGYGEKAIFALSSISSPMSSSGALESKWMTFYGSMRMRRDSNQYGFEPPGTREEITALHELAAGFIERIEILLERS